MYNPRVVTEKPITLTFSSDEDLRKLGGQGLFDASGVKLLSTFFTAQELIEIEGLQKSILAWISKDPKYATAYFTDPFACLERYFKVENSELREKLKTLAEAAKTLVSSAALPPLDKISVR